MYCPVATSGIVSVPFAEVVNSWGGVLESLGVTVTLKPGIPFCHPNVIAVDMSSESGTNASVNSTEARGGDTRSVSPRHAAAPSAARDEAHMRTDDHENNVHWVDMANTLLGDLRDSTR
jgi:hypothetical protein